MEKALLQLITLSTCPAFLWPTVLQPDSLQLISEADQPYSSSSDQQSPDVPQIDADQPRLSPRSTTRNCSALNPTWQRKRKFTMEFFGVATLGIRWMTPASGIGGPPFYNKSFIIEMMETDRSTFTDLVVQKKKPKYPNIWKSSVNRTIRQLTFQETSCWS